MPSKMGMPDQLEGMEGERELLRSSDAVGKENIARDNQILLSLPLHVVNNASLAVSGSVDASG